MRTKILMAALACLFVLPGCSKREHEHTLLTSHASYCFYSDTSSFEQLRDKLEQSGIDFDTDEVKNCVAVRGAADAEKVDAIKAELFGTPPPNGSISMGEERNRKLVDLLNSHGIETKTHNWHGNEFISWSPDDSEKAEELIERMRGEGCPANSDKVARTVKCGATP